MPLELTHVNRRVNSRVQNLLVLRCRNLVQRLKLPSPNPGVCPSADLGVFHSLPTKGDYLPPPAALVLLISKAAKLGAELIPVIILAIELYRSKR